MFTARYGQSPYIIQIRFVFKRLTKCLEYLSEILAADTR